MADQWQQENGQNTQGAAGADTDAEFQEELESSEADRAEQRAQLSEEEQAWSTDQPLGVSDEVPEGDAVEQHLEVGLDDDEYRE